MGVVWTQVARSFLCRLDIHRWGEWWALSKRTFAMRTCERCGFIDMEQPY